MKVKVFAENANHLYTRYYTVPCDTLRLCVLVNCSSYGDTIQFNVIVLLTKYVSYTFQLLLNLVLV